MVSPPRARSIRRTSAAGTAGTRLASCASIRSRSASGMVGIRLTARQPRAARPRQRDQPSAAAPASSSAALASASQSTAPSRPRPGQGRVGDDARPARSGARTSTVSPCGAAICTRARRRAGRPARSPAPTRLPRPPRRAGAPRHPARGSIRHGHEIAGAEPRRPRSRAKSARPLCPSPTTGLARLTRRWRCALARSRLSATVAGPRRAAHPPSDAAQLRGGQAERHLERRGSTSRASKIAVRASAPAATATRPTARPRKARSASCRPACRSASRPARCGRGRGRCAWSSRASACASACRRDPPPPAARRRGQLGGTAAARCPRRASQVALPRQRLAQVRLLARTARSSRARATRALARRATRPRRGPDGGPGPAPACAAVGSMPQQKIARLPPPALPNAVGQHFDHGPPAAARRSSVRRAAQLPKARDHRRDLGRPGHDAHGEARVAFGGCAAGRIAHARCTASRR